MISVNYITPGTFGRVKYYHVHTDRDGTEVRLRIYQRDYTGNSTEMASMRSLRLEVQGSNEDIAAPIVKTSLVFSFADDEENGTDGEGRKHGGWREFYTPDATLYYVTVERKPAGGNYALLWGGYITPDSWSEGLETDSDITITVRDNIGHLKDFPFDLAGDGDGLASVEAIVTGAMQKIQFPMTLKYSKTAEGDAAALQDTGGVNIWDAMLNVSQFEGKDWGDVLETVLGDLGLVLRFVGGGAYWCGPLRNLTLLGGTAIKTGQNMVDFQVGGTRFIDPAYKQIIESLSYEVNSELELDPDKGLSNFSSSPDTVWTTLGASTNGWQKTNATGWTSALAAFGKPTSIRTNTLNGAALLVMNNVINAAYVMQVHTSAVAVMMNFENGTAYSRGLSIASFLRLAKITYTVAYYATAYGSGTVRYWNGSSWGTSAVELSQSYDRNSAGAKTLEMVLSDCEDVGDDGFLAVTIKEVDYVNSLPSSASWTNGGSNYAPVTAIVLSSTEGVVSGNRVTTINDEKYNVTLDRTPEIGVLSKDIGRINNSTYENVLYRPSAGHTPWSYQTQWSDQSAALPFPVQVHLSILCYHFTGMEVLEGTCHRTDGLPWDFGAIYGYREKGGAGNLARFLLMGGTLDLVTGWMTSAIFHTFVEYLETWGANPVPDYTIVEGAAGTTGGTQGGSSGGSSGGGQQSAGGRVGSLSQLSDVSLTSPINGDVLQFDGSEWKNVSIAGDFVTVNTPQTINGNKVFAGEVEMQGTQSLLPSHYFHNLYNNTEHVYEHFYPTNRGGGDNPTVGHLRVWRGSTYRELVLNGIDGTLKWNGNALEMASNRVTSLSASSTDNQYPSAKCVYDLIGDIETLLSEI